MMTLQEQQTGDASQVQTTTQVIQRNIQTKLKRENTELNETIWGQDMPNSGGGGTTELCIKYFR
jgi:hypothetical protein